MAAAPLTVLVAHNAYQQRGGEDAVAQAEVALLRAHGHTVIELHRDNQAIETSGSTAVLADTMWSRSSARELRQLILAHAPDIVHVHNSFPLLSPSIYWTANRSRVPVVQTLHNFRLMCPQAMFLRDGAICEECLGTLPWRAVVHGCYRGSRAQSAALTGMLGLHRALGSYRSKVTRYIALSEFSKTKFTAAGFAPSKLCVKPNFVDLAQTPEQTPERGGVLFVGRLSEEKGLSVLLRALQRAPLPCTVIGTGPQESLRAAHPEVRWLGWQERKDVYAEMARASCLVMPSIGYEQFPLTLAEAFACGLPIIASRLGPLAELIEHGRTGLLFVPGDDAELARQLALVARAPAQLAEMGRHARREYLEKYTPERNYQQLMRIYAEARAAQGPNP